MRCSTEASSSVAAWLQDIPIPGAARISFCESLPILRFAIYVVVWYVEKMLGDSISVPIVAVQDRVFGFDVAV